MLINFQFNVCFNSAKENMIKIDEQKFQQLVLKLTLSSSGTKIRISDKKCRNNNINILLPTDKRAFQQVFDVLVADS